MDDIHCIPSTLLAMFIIVVGGNASNQHIANLILTWSMHHVGIPTHASSIVMPWMIVADGDDRGSELTQLWGFPFGIPCQLRRKRVGNQSDTLATQLEAGVAKPGNFHDSFAFPNKFGRGLLSSPEFYCTIRMGVLQGGREHFVLLDLLNRFYSFI